MSAFDKSFERALAATKKKVSAEPALRKLNDALHKITLNRYLPHVPMREIFAAVKDSGFVAKDEEEVPFALLGHDGKATVEYVYPGKALLSSGKRHLYYLQITWHRMDSGNFETVAYAGYQGAE